MNSIRIEINFQDRETIKLDSGCFSSRMSHWNLRDTCVYGEKKLTWVYLLEANYTMPSEEFLELVGANIEEAKEVLLKNNSYLTEETVQEHLTLEVKYFYQLLETHKLVDVKFTIIDQS